MLLFCASEVERRVTCFAFVAIDVDQEFEPQHVKVLSPPSETAASSNLLATG